MVFCDIFERGYPPDELMIIVSMFQHEPQEIVVRLTGWMRKEPLTILTPPRATVIVHVRLSRQAEVITIELKKNRVPLAVVIRTVEPPGL